MAIVLCLSSFTVLGTDNSNKKITIEYKEEPIAFDVESIIKNDRILVPFRAILEVMGCVVYYAEEDGSE